MIQNAVRADIVLVVNVKKQKNGEYQRTKGGHNCSDVSHFGDIGFCS
jgi:hypothetical protein